MKVHTEAYEWVQRYARDDEISVLDLGGRDLNGNCKPLYPKAEYVVLDLRDGPNVDIVADAATWTPDREYDVVICTEVFEHAPEWRAICATAYKACKPDGQFIVTCAGPGRAPHSGIEATALQPGEYYENVSKFELLDTLHAIGFREIVVERQGNDVRAFAVR